MTAHRTLYAYAWDIADRGVAAFVDEALALGMDSVALATSYHAGKFLRPHAPRGGRVVFPEDGVVYFNPSGHYGEITPRVHSDAVLRGVLRALLDDGRLAVQGWTILLHNSALGAAWPQYTARNVFGDGYVYSLCPMNQAVFDYAVNLARDVAAQGVAAVLLETPGWLPYAHGYHHEFSQVRSNAWLDAMLGLCMCDACAAAGKAAGVDTAALKDRIAGSIDAYLDGAADATPGQALDWLADQQGDAELAAFLRLRNSRVTALVRAIRAALPPATSLAVIPTVQRPSAHAWMEGSDLAALAEAADWLEMPFYEPDCARTLADAAETLRRAPAAKVRAILRPGPPDLGDGAQLGAALDALTALGISEFAFYNYGLLRRDRLAALGTALAQFDRRTS
ncbi:MAG: hypothetical protein V4463_09325 [Pseudomonadota bacterium]